MRGNTALVALILALAIALGALREFLFINLNYAIDHVANHRPFSYAHSAFTAVVKDLDLRGLVALKWGFALCFIGAMLGLSVILSKVLFHDHRYGRMLVVGFMLIGALALLLNLGGRVVHPHLDLVSVKLLHLLQYPVLLFFLWAASMLRKRTA